ncbi:MAG: hypothetical protein IKE63_00680 [Bacilli bacterium]|nr:hypothetical protein [Bacilli bacterium]
MILATTKNLCTDASLNTIMYYTKNVLNLIVIIAPILAIVGFTILFFQLINNPDNNKLIKKLVNSLKALVIIFFIPMLVTIVMSLVGNNTKISVCYKNATKPSLYSKYIKIDPGKPSSVITDPSGYDSGTFRQLDFSCKSKHIKAQFSCDTIHIVERHINDFNYYNFNTAINSYGGFDKYMKSLGGYFEKYYGYQPKVTTVYEFQQVAEYVLGMIVIYGFDYYNGDNGKYCKWGGGCQKMSAIRKGETPGVASSDAFYPYQLVHTEDGLSDAKHFDKLISNKGAINMTTCCNWTTDMVYYKAGIFGTGRTAVNSSGNFAGLAKAKTNKIITNYEEIKPGDIIEWFDNPINLNDPDSWASSGWYHVSFVGEVDYKKKTFTAYETGSGLTSSRNHKVVHKMSKKLKNAAIIRVIDLK